MSASRTARALWNEDRMFGMAHGIVIRLFGWALHIEIWKEKR